MAQIGWVFLDDRGGRHRVGLYHGDQSGHVLIHCNLRVVEIDFSVKESKTYSFFIEDEFCEVHLEKEKEGFSYDFQVNKKVDTPRNQERRIVDRRNFRYLLLLAAGLVVIIAAILFAVRQWESRSVVGNLALPALSGQEMAALQGSGRHTDARFFMVRENGRRVLFYGFTTAAGRQISGRLPAGASDPVVLPNGFPLADKDAFSVRYLPQRPEIHVIDFFQPTTETLNVYLARAIAAEAAAHPEELDGYVRCLVEQVRSVHGWPGLAHVIFQTQTPKENRRHNRDSYQRVIRSSDMQQYLDEKCWDQ